LCTNTGKAAATDAHPATTAAYMIDGNPTTYWGTNNAAATAVWWYDFDTDVEIISMAVRTVDTAGQRVTQAEVVYSDDASTWTTAWTMDLRGSGTSGKFKYYPPLDFGAISLPSGFKAFAIQMEWQAANAFSMAEIAMRVVASGDDVIPLVAVTAHADQEYPTLVAGLAIDGNAATYWSANNGTSGQKWWIEFDCVDPIGIRQITIQANNEPVYHDQTPSDFVVMGKRLDGEWSPIWMEEGHSWNASETKTFTCPFAYGDGQEPVSP
jgi:hypothetical protein